MQMHEAAQVLEVIGEETANERLAEGWKLLAVLPGLPRGSSSSTTVIYVLGKPKGVSASSIR
ncbi:hypothetical protein SAMN03159362_4521 [Pseudomonas sp. NFIX51]|uniref:hypothetical protein n=1 Tax=unclassified Pseudomonas TaxID=196821 RepID=UPI0008AD8177|nr:MULTISPECIES: hypothetical protein [unclassified Pseudomonas]SEM38642.1 hypothetical protein SAMN03159414_5077 [Pseudomonas sp. NFACC41-3]SMH58852.1 hypothetical protein SAMN03159362_4521 [Pseudomonas sp. NFIX51]